MKPEEPPASPIESVGAALQALEGVDCRPDAPLSECVSMGVGGPARWLATVESVEALAGVRSVARESGVRFMMLGGGSNTLFGPGGFDGVVIRLGRGFRALEAGAESGQITAGAGAQLSAVMNFAKRHGLSGLEWAAGIPGTLGGALAGNAGTPTGEICRQSEWVEVLGEDGRPERLARGAFQFGYRHSELAGRIILRAALKLAADEPRAIQERIDAALAKRWTQPVGVKCSGCMFKNPPGDYAGRLIDAAGLKGARVGGAVVSDEHANFMLNTDGATAEDVAGLIRLVRGRVRERFGVELQLEVRALGFEDRVSLET